jgi:hypothetical protein
LEVSNQQNNVEKNVNFERIEAFWTFNFMLWALDYWFHNSFTEGFAVFLLPQDMLP